MDILQKIKRMVLEPKIYAVLVTSVRGQVLHLGAHFSLEEAYASARERMKAFIPHKEGESLDIELWNTMSSRQVLAQIIDPSKIDQIIPLTENNQPVVTPIAHGTFMGSVDQLPPILRALLDEGAKPEPVGTQPATITEHIQDMKDVKNELMQKLIADGDVAQVEKVRDLLGANSRRYVLKAIEKKKSTALPVEVPKEEKK